MKKRTIPGFGFILGLLFTFLFLQAQAQETHVKVTGIRSGKGKICLSAFKDNETFDKEQPYKSFVFDKKSLVNGTLNLVIKLEPGIFGLALLDDENDNGKMDKNFIRMPKEGFGFSNFFLEKLKKPVFDDFKVDLRSAQNKVNIKVKYL